MNDININEYDYELPENRIAKFPLEQRDFSKLLIYNKGDISEAKFCNLPDLLSQKSLLVFNNTKVIHARIIFHKSTGARIEVFCLEPDQPVDYAQNFAETKNCKWKCVVGNLKKWKNEILEKPFTYNNIDDILRVEKDEENNETLTLSFSWSSGLSFAQVLEACGNVPIPPYLKRESQNIDNDRYQTIYSKLEGSVAAPTAGLHFTNKVLDDLESKNIAIEEVTLHVGAGTFKPVKTDLANDHVMHSEHFLVKKSTIKNLIVNIGNITAVGTTSVRTLESLYWIGCKIHENSAAKDLNVRQFEPYNNSYQNLKAEESLQCILNYLEKNGIDALETSTQIMIAPEYKPRIVSRLITNFHQPKSTLLLLISAFVGNDWHAMYEYAMNHDFRFLSYGDSSLIVPKP